MLLRLQSVAILEMFRKCSIKCLKKNVPGTSKESQRNHQLPPINSHAAKLNKNKQRRELESLKHYYSTDCFTNETVN